MIKEPISQEKQILNFMQQGKGITQKDAISLFNCYRLSDRIFTLRKQHEIKTKLTPNQSGRGSYATYFMPNTDAVRF